MCNIRFFMIKSLRLWLLLPLLAWSHLLLADPAFYRLEKGEQTLWLLGSVHAGTPALYPLPAPIEAAWRQSRQLVVEVDLTRIPPEELAAMGPLTRLSPPQTLSRMLPAPLYQRLVSAAHELGISPESLEGLQPWFAALTLTQAALTRHGFDPALGIDSHFLALASHEGKPVIGLEGFAEQLGYLASVAKYQEVMLSSTLDELTGFRAAFDKVLKAWQAGDEKTLTTLLREEMGPAELQAWLEQKLLAERNHRWLAKLPSLPAQSLVVVGALHLYGTDGLLEGAKKIGYQVKPITNPIAD